MQINDTFFDFIDLFYLIFNSIPKTNKNTLFLELLGCLYDEAGIEIGADKIHNHVYNITNKRSAFKPEVRALANEHILHEVSQSLSTLVNESIIHRDEFINKLLFLVKRDTESFLPGDHDFFENHKEKPELILAYILLRTVVLSPVNREKCHSADYNPFAEYCMPAFESTPDLESDQIHADLIQTSAYMYQSLKQDRTSMPDFHSELLSKAITYDTYKYEFHLQRSFSIVSGSDDEKSLDDFIHIPDNLLLIGEGGIGKTTFLYSRLKNYHDANDKHSVPLYLKLSECSTSTDPKHMILDSLYKCMSYAVNGRPLESHKDLLDAFSHPCSANDIPAYTLLLDGFNELPATNFGKIRNYIADEIDRLLKCHNLRIILTSREVDLYGISLNKFKVIKANGISKKDVTDYLCTLYPEKAVQSLVRKADLMEYLRIPLFLMMYTSVNSDTFPTPKSRGAILYHFYNGDHSFYSEKKHSENSYDREVALFTKFILDFLLPDIGNYMVSSDVFHISEKTFLKLLVKCLTESERFFSLHAAPYVPYESRPNSLRRIAKAFSALDYEDVLLLATDSLGILNRDASGKLYFSHQYIRDYFASMYILRELLYATLVAEHTPSNVPELTYQWGDIHWNSEQIQLLHELLDFPSVYQNGDLIYDVLQLFKNNQPYPLQASRYALSNLVGVLSQNAHGDLSVYDFSYLDLRGCNLTNINFHNVATNISSSFAHSKIGIDTFITDSHMKDILKWNLSDDGRYIISISSDLEIKVWNIATQSCIYTRRNHEPMDNFHSVGTLELHEDGTLALITYLDVNQKMIVATTYQLSEDTQTTYMDGFTYNRSYIGIYYLPDTKHLLAIGYSGIYEFEIGNRFPFITHQYPPQSFLERLFACTKATVWDSPNTPKAFCVLFPLAEDNLLYMEAIKTDDSYTVTYHIYDFANGRFFPLYMAENQTTKELSFVTETTNVTLLQSITAISKDGKLAAFWVNDALYTYTVSQNNGKLRLASDNRFRGIHHISFSHQDGTTLTLASNTLYQLNVKTGEILYQRAISIKTNKELAFVTTNQLLFNIATGYGPNSMIQSENIYTGIDTVLRLSSSGSMIDTYINEEAHLLYTLHHNGTLLYWDAYTLSLVNSYNFAVGRRILVADYSETLALLCFASCPQHSSMYSTQYALTKVDLNTGTHITSDEVFSHISDIHITDNGKYLIVLTEKEIHLMDIGTMTTLSTCRQIYGGSPKNHIFSDDALVYLFFYQPVVYHNVDYYDIIVSYRITEEHLLIPDRVTYVPSLDLKGEAPAVCYTMLDSSGTALVKALDPDTDATIELRTLTYGKPEEFNFRSYYDAEYIEYPLSSWAPACINAKSPIYFEPHSGRNIDMQTFDKCFRPFDSNIVYKDGFYYEHRLPEDRYIKLNISFPKHCTPICYSRNLAALYYFDTEQQRIAKYSINEQKTTHHSIELYNNFLLYGCNFSFCTGLYQNACVYMWGPYTGDHIPTDIWEGYHE